MKTKILVTLLTSILVTGCGSLSGYSESNSSFGCKAPDGVSCKSVSGVYANAEQDNLPSQRQHKKEIAPSASPIEFPSQASKQLPVAMPGLPIRSQIRTLRIWVAPWVDEEGDLHDQNYMYVVLQPGKWLVEHSREATVRKSLQRLRPLGQPNLAPAQSTNSAESNDSSPEQDARELASNAPTETGDAK